MQTSNIQFTAKLNTVKLLETTTFKIIERESISDLKPVIDSLWDKPLKGFGKGGYRYYLKIIGDKLLNKYPQLQEATYSILNFTDKNPNATKKELQEFVSPIIKKLGDTMDVTI